MTQHATPAHLRADKHQTGARHSGGTAMAAGGEHVHADPPGRAWLRVALWLSLCVVALWVLLGGKSDLYIAPNVRWTVWLAVIASIVLALADGAAALERGVVPAFTWMSGGRLRPDLALLFLPCALGILVPPLTLGASSILAHDVVIAYVHAPSMAPDHVVGAIAPPNEVHTASILQLQYQAAHNQLVAGSTIQVTGFALHRSDLPAGTWLLVRFVTPHCMAEAQPVGLLIRTGPGGSAPTDNTWVTVAGPITAATINGDGVAVVQPATLQAIATPPDPYLID